MCVCRILARKVSAIFLLFAATVIAASAQTLSTLWTFDYSDDGAYPTDALVQGTDGNFYGTTSGGSDSSCGYIGCGTVFKIGPFGGLNTLYSFKGTDGANPYGGLVQAKNGYFYGTTRVGGTNGFGTVYKIDSNGKLTTLHSFNGSDGEVLFAALIQANDGNFYGTTVDGGANGYGTVFKITPAAILTTLYSFCPEANCADGINPYGGLIQGSDGNFYGTTANGGANLGPNNICAYGWGTVFKITPSGTLTTLHSFCSQSNPNCTDGFGPQAGLVQANDGKLYGTTANGGANNYGTIFKISPQGALTTLYSFAGLDTWRVDNPAQLRRDGLRLQPCRRAAARHEWELLWNNWRGVLR